MILFLHLFSFPIQFCCWRCLFWKSATVYCATKFGADCTQVHSPISASCFCSLSEWSDKFIWLVLIQCGRTWIQTVFLVNWLVSYGTKSTFPSFCCKKLWLLCIIVSCVSPSCTQQFSLLSVVKLNTGPWKEREFYVVLLH